MTLKQKLQSGKFVVTAELAPPKGTNLERAIQKAKIMKDSVDAINVTDNQRAVMRLSSLALCKILIDQGIEPIFQLTCRDRNRLALESDLLGAHALGIRNVLVVSGDHPIHGDHKNTKPVYDIDSVQLIDIIKKMNNGEDSNGNKLDGSTDFNIGGVVNPGSDLLEPQIIKMEKKAAHGAEFFQTQVIYDIELFRDFLNQTKHIKTKILAGILPLKSAKMARFMNDNVPGVKVPEELIKELEDSKEPIKTGIDQAIRLIKELKELCNGVHIMAVGNEEIVPEIVKGAGL